MTTTETPSVDDLWQMLGWVERLEFLGFEDRWGEPFPTGDWREAPKAIQGRITAAVRAEAIRERDEAVALLRRWVESYAVIEDRGYGGWDAARNTRAFLARFPEAEGGEG